MEVENTYYFKIFIIDVAIRTITLPSGRTATGELGYEELDLTPEEIQQGTQTANRLGYSNPDLGEIRGALQEPIGYSSENAVSTLTDTQVKEQNLTPLPSTEIKESPPTTEEPTRTVKMLNKNTGQEYSFTGTDKEIAAQMSKIRQYQAAGYDITSEDTSIDLSEDPAITKERMEADQSLTELKDLQSKLTSFDVSNDPVLISMQNSITSQWDQRIREQQEANRRRQESMKTLGIRLGSRWTGGLQAGTMFGGIISEEERQGAKRIDELQVKKEVALAEARSAYEKQKWDKYVQLVNIAQKNYEQQRQEFADLSKATIEQNKFLLQIEQEERLRMKDSLDASDKLIKSIGYLTLNSFIGDPTKDQETLKAIAAQYGVDPNMLLSEVQRLDNEKVKYPAGIIGEYQFYRDQAQAAGVPPENIMDFNQYQTADANRKAKAASGGLGALTVLQGYDREQRLATDIEKNLKEYRVIQRQISVIDAAMNEAKKAGFNGTSLNAPSQSIIIAFNKMLDPTSVVRESEYARSGSGQGLSERISGTFLKLQQGGAGLTQKELQSFYTTAKALANGYIAQTKDYLQRTKNSAATLQKVTGGQFGSLENVLTPDLMDILEGTSDGVTVGLPGGQSWTFPDQASADKFKRAYEEQAQQSIAWQ